MRILFPVLLVFLFSCSVTKQSALSADIDPFHSTAIKDVTCSNGAVVSAHPIASQVGVYILKKGGNAIDAAIAVQLALAVVYPNAGNLGGGGFMVARLANNNTIALDYREKAPSSATRGMYLDNNGDPVPLKSTRGASSSGVPGTVAGLFECMKYAKLSFNELVEPEIILAEQGYALTQREANALNRLQPDLNAYNTKPNIFQRTATWEEGDTLIQNDLANTLKRIKQKGKKAFYGGKTAKLIVEEMKRGAGYVTLDDLQNYEAKWREPHQFVYRDYEVISMPPPSSGGILLHQMLKMIENRDIAGQGALSAKSVQLMTEAERRAYADRAQYMGDPDFYKVPVTALTDSSYLANRMADFDTAVAGNSQLIKPGQIPTHESEETTHISIIDKEGNAVAVTTTLNDSYGSRVVVGEAGFFLNDEMDDFSIKPGVPNMYGAVGGEANSIQPGKRMLSSMTPTIVLHQHKPFLVVGTPGGTTIPTSVFQTIVDIIEFGLSPREAIDLPKFHHQWLPDIIHTEENFPENSMEGLKLATQYTFLVSERFQTSLAIGYIQEFEMASFNSLRQKKEYLSGTLYNPIFVAARRWNNQLHTLNKSTTMPLCIVPTAMLL